MVLVQKSSSQYTALVVFGPDRFSFVDHVKSQKNLFSPSGGPPLADGNGWLNLIPAFAKGFKTR
jgi:hypothetical protein